LPRFEGLKMFCVEILRPSLSDGLRMTNWAAVLESLWDNIQGKNRMLNTDPSKLRARGCGSQWKSGLRIWGWRRGGVRLRILELRRVVGRREVRSRP
jgi:hypothetical protein